MTETKQAAFPGQVLRVDKDAEDKHVLRNVKTGTTRKLRTVLDGKTSVVIEDAKGTRIFWYLANAFADHESITSEFNKMAFVDEKIRGYVTHQKLWLADEGFTYTYAGQPNDPTPMPPFFGKLRDKVIQLTGLVCPRDAPSVTYPGGLVNKYRDGKDSVGWHKDAEPDLDTGVPIVGVSTGAAAKFQFRVPTDTSLILSIRVQSGSVYWFYSTLPHRVPKDDKRTGIRYNATFRQSRAQQASRGLRAPATLTHSQSSRGLRAPATLTHSQSSSSSSSSSASNKRKVDDAFEDAGDASVAKKLRA
jgi:alkylated DNA repair dioxygenase AlkB